MQINIDNYLKETQPIIYKTFANSLQKDKLSHAYLLYGDSGVPLLEIAKFLAKSILCDDPSPLACDKCISCVRVDEGNYHDFIVYDGSTETIKKDDLNAIERQFENKAFESKGIQIYVIHLIENIQEKTINTLLKFLEEPGIKIYAFLTTNNINAILPTIISRCQLLRMKPTDRESVVNNSINEGIEPKDAELLSYFYSDSSLIMDFRQDEEKYELYQCAKEGFETILEALKCKDNRKLMYTFEKEITPKMNDKVSARFFIDLLIEAFEDILNIQHNQKPILQNYATILTDIANSNTNIDSKLLTIMQCRNWINMNVNIAQLFDYLMINICKED